MSTPRVQEIGVAASLPFPLPALTVHEPPKVQRRKAHYVCTPRVQETDVAGIALTAVDALYPSS